MSDYADLRFYVGDNEGDPLYLIFAINDSPENLILYVNGQAPTYLGKCRLPDHADGDLLVYAIPPMRGNVRALEIRSENTDPNIDPFISYAEMRNYPPEFI